VKKITSKSGRKSPDLKKKRRTEEGSDRTASISICRKKMGKQGRASSAIKNLLRGEMNWEVSVLIGGTTVSTRPLVTRLPS